MNWFNIECLLRDLPAKIPWKEVQNGVKSFSELTKTENKYMNLQWSKRELRALTIPELLVWGEVNSLQLFPRYSWKAIQPVVGCQSQETGFMIRGRCQSFVLWNRQIIQESETGLLKSVQQKFSAKRSTNAKQQQQQQQCFFSFHLQEGSDTARRLQISPL